MESMPLGTGIEIDRLFSFVRNWSSYLKINHSLWYGGWSFLHVRNFIFHIVHLRGTLKIKMAVKMVLVEFPGPVAMLILNQKIKRGWLKNITAALFRHQVKLITKKELHSKLQLNFYQNILL